MAQIRINNDNLVLEKSCTLTDFLIRQGYTHTHFAVAVNQVFVPRDQYSTTFLNDGDVVDIISPMQGG